MKPEKDYLAFRKRLEIELQSEFRVRMIVRTVLEYFKYSRNTVFKSKDHHIAYVRHLIFYLCYCIYGIDCTFIGRTIKINRSTIWDGADVIRHKLDDLKVQTDVDNLRQILVKVLNGESYNS